MLGSLHLPDYNIVLLNQCLEAARFLHTQFNSLYVPSMTSQFLSVGENIACCEGVISALPDEPSVCTPLPMVTEQFGSRSK